MVIDHEKITRTFPEGPGTLEMIAMYRCGWQNRQGVSINGAKTLDAA